MREILRFFDSLNLPMNSFDGGTYFENNTESANCLQVWFKPGKNLRGEPSIFGEINVMHGGRYHAMDISFPLTTWMEDGPRIVREFLAKYGK